MFAFAIWDENKREFIIARETARVSPFTTVPHGDGPSYFASEIKSLLAARAVVPEINYPALPTIWRIMRPPAKRRYSAASSACCPPHARVARRADSHQKILDLQFDASGAYAQRSDERLHRRVDRMFPLVRLRLMAVFPSACFSPAALTLAIAAVMSGMVSEPIKLFPWPSPTRSQRTGLCASGRANHFRRTITNHRQPKTSSRIAQADLARR